MGETVPWSNFSLPAISSARPFFQSDNSRCRCCSSCDFLSFFFFADQDRVGQRCGNFPRYYSSCSQRVSVFSRESKKLYYGLFLRYLVEYVAWQMWAHDCFLFFLYFSSNFVATTAPPFNLNFIRNRLPQNVTSVPEIKRFLPIGSQFNEGQVELVNGTVSNILHILSANRNKNVRLFLDSTTLSLRPDFDTVFLFYRSTITPLSA